MELELLQLETVLMLVLFNFCDLKTVILLFFISILTPIFFKTLSSELIIFGFMFKKDNFFPAKAAAIKYVPNSILSNITL